MPRPSLSLLNLGQPAPGQALGDWLYTSLRDAILDGRLPQDSRLPGSRSLAEHYRLARGTVQSAYAQLTCEGYLLTEPGAGTRVAAVQAPLAPPPPAPAPAPASSAPRLAWRERLSGHTPAFPLYGVPAGGRGTFFPHTADIDGFPIDLWRNLHNRHLRASRRALMCDGPAAGSLALRQALANHLAVARGVRTPPECILITSSVQQGLDLCLRLLVEPGEAVWTEDPGYPGARQLIQAHGARCVDVPVDDQGLRVADGIALAPDARLAYLTPSHQAPLGSALSPVRRQQLLAWARARGAYLFEDDYDSEYRFVTKPIPALRSLTDAEDRVILAGTLSKLMFPAIRLAWLVLPPQLVESATYAASLMFRHANTVTQAVMADFLEEGHFDRHVRRMRKRYAERAEAFSAAARQHWQGLIEVPPIGAGLDVPCWLQGLDEAQAFEHLAAADIHCLPLCHYCQAPQPAGLVMGFAAYTPEQIDTGAARAAQALSPLPRIRPGGI